MKKSKKIGYSLFLTWILMLSLVFSACGSNEEESVSVEPVTIQTTQETTAAQTTAAPQTTEAETTAAETTTEAVTEPETTTEAETEEQISKALKGLRKNYGSIFVVTGTENLNMRYTPVDGVVIGVIPENGGGEILEAAQDGWVKVRSGGMDGYVSGDYILTGEEAEAAAEKNVVRKVIVDEEVVNVRAEASTESAAIASAMKGDKFIYLDKEGDFYKIRFNEETEAYISKTVSSLGYYLSEAVSTGAEVPEAETTVSEAENGESAAPAETASETTAAETPAQNTTPNGLVVCIDAGHQAHGISEQEPNGPGSSVMKAKLTTGTSGCVSGKAEHEVNLEVALKLQAILEARGYTVIMIRTTADCPMSNAERAVYANNSGASVFVRIHCNSLDDSSVTGVINYAPSAANPYLNGNLVNSSNTLAQLMANGISAATGCLNRGVLQDDGMTGINWCQIPVTIVEMGFMSNPTEDLLLCDASYQQKLAEGMANGLDAYFGR